MNRQHILAYFKYCEQSIAGQSSLVQDLTYGVFDIWPCLAYYQYHNKRIATISWQNYVGMIIKNLVISQGNSFTFNASK